MTGVMPWRGVKAEIQPQLGEPEQQTLLGQQASCERTKIEKERQLKSSGLTPSPTVGQKRQG